MSFSATPTSRASSWRKRKHAKWRRAAKRSAIESSPRRATREAETAQRAEAAQLAREAQRSAGARRPNARRRGASAATQAGSSERASSKCQLADLKPAIRIAASCLRSATSCSIRASHVESGRGDDDRSVGAVHGRLSRALGPHRGPYGLRRQRRDESATLRAARERGSRRLGRARHRCGTHRDRRLWRSTPIAGNDTPGGRQQNRRIEIVVSDAEGVSPTRPADLL